MTALFVVALGGCGRAPRQVPLRPLPAAESVWLDPAPGTWETPLPAAHYPFTHEGDTELHGERRRRRDPCAPAVGVPGPEVTYELLVQRPGVLHAVVVPASGIDLELALVTENGMCLARGDGKRQGEVLARAVEPGTYRLIVDTRGWVGGDYRLEVQLGPAQPELIGSVWNTYYYLANEGDHVGEKKDTPLLTADCDILGDVPQAFHDDLCIEGSGMLSDGRVVNYAATCTDACYAALTCGRRKYKICYQVLDGDRYRWGMGAGGRVLEPDLSVAVDPKVIPLGTVMYLPELDGVVPPGRSTPHSGCVRADDIGGAIKGNHIDIFSGTRQRWRAWERIFPTRTWFTVVLHHPKCYGIPGAAGGGASSPTSLASRARTGR